MVQQTYSHDFMTAVSDAGVITFVLDGRGTGFQGRAFRTIVSKQFGKYEVADQIAGAK